MLFHGARGPILILLLLAALPGEVASAKNKPTGQQQHEEGSSGSRPGSLEYFEEYMRQHSGRLNPDKALYPNVDSTPIQSVYSEGPVARYDPYNPSAPPLPLYANSAPPPRAQSQYVPGPPPPLPGSGSMVPHVTPYGGRIQQHQGSASYSYSPDYYQQPQIGENVPMAGVAGQQQYYRPPNFVPTPAGVVPQPYIPGYYTQQATQQQQFGGQLPLSNGPSGLVPGNNYYPGTPYQYGNTAIPSVGAVSPQLRHQFVLNGYNSYQPNALNCYPLSQNQLIKGLTQFEMRNRILEQLSQGTWRSDIQFTMQRHRASWVDLTQGNRWKPRSTMLHDALEMAIKNRDVDSTDLIEILVTLTSDEKQLVINSGFCDRMVQHNELKDEKVLFARLSRYGRLMDSLCRNMREVYSIHIDEPTVASDMSVLYNYLVNGHQFKFSSTVEMVIVMLTRRNYSQLRRTFEAYDAHYRTDIISQLAQLRNRKPRSHFLQAVEAIVLDVWRGRPHYFGELLKLKLGKLLDSVSYNDRDAHWDVRRILLTRAQVDLVDIVEAFRNFRYREQTYNGMAGLETVLLMAKANTRWLGRDRAKFEAYLDLIYAVRTAEQHRMGTTVYYRQNQ